jgi:general secretion pathway protein D
MRHPRSGLAASFRTGPAIVIAAGWLALASCESLVEDQALRGAMSSVTRAEDAPVPSGAPVVLGDEAARESSQPKTEVVEGDSRFVSPVGRNGAARKGGDVLLDFADAEVRDVVRTVLGDILKVPYAVDPQVQGKVTLKTSTPLRKQDVVAALETALKANGAVIVLADNVYNVVPAADAQKRIDGFEISGSAQARGPGYGIEIVPLSHIAAAEMQKLLEPVAPAGGVASVDAQRNLIFLAGTSQERAAMLDTIRLFDVDYLKGMSYALVRPDHIEVQALAQELTRVFQSTGGSSAGLLRFVPLSRINTLLVVTPRVAQLRAVEKWVDRLDVPPRGAGRGVYYYRLQHAKAADVARSLAAVYGSAVQTGPEDTASGGDMMTEPPASGPAPAPEPPPPPAAAGPNGSSLQIAVDQANNALIIRARGSEYAGLERFLKEVDVAPDQVLIEVTIAEVTLNDTLKYGVEWYFKNADDQKYSLGRSLRPAPTVPGFNFTYTIPDVEVALSALGSITDVQVISAPKLLTLNNRPANLQFGDQVPVVTQTATGVRDAADPTIVNSIQLRDTGIVLKVTPRISRGGTVFVDVNQEVSSAVQTTTSGIDSPTIQQRRISSTVAVQDGDSIALGGMIRQSDTRSNSGVPVLRDIPVVGNLFSSTNNTGARTELLIFLRPRIIPNAAAAREMTEQLKRGLKYLDVAPVPRPRP